MTLRKTKQPKNKPVRKLMPTTPKAGRVEPRLLNDLRQLIIEARQAASVAVNASLTLMYWRIGQRIREDVLGNSRAEYGEQIVATVSRQLTLEHGRSFGDKNLRHMMRFAEMFPDMAIVSTLSRQLAWSHFLELIYLKDRLARDFYAQMCQLENWSVRTLRDRIGSMLFERTALSKKPEQLIQTELTTLRKQGDIQPPLLLKDPYVLDFLGLSDRYLEKDLEDAILRELETFLLELGDAPPLGIILCTGKKRDQIEMLELDKSGIHVAEYLTVLPPREVFAQKIQDAMTQARARLESTLPNAP